MIYLYRVPPAAGRTLAAGCLLEKMQDAIESGDAQQLQQAVLGLHAGSTDIMTLLSLLGAHNDLLTETARLNVVSLCRTIAQDFSIAQVDISCANCLALGD